MPLRYHPLISVLCSLILVVTSFLFQLIALTTTWWATFTARTDLGKPKEDGHYGLWTLCSTKGPYWKEDCDKLDTFFQLPTYSKVSGIIGIVHLLVLLTLLPLELLWAAQIFRNLQNVSIKPKALCIAKVVIAVVAVILSTLVAVFISINEKIQSEYSVQKQWSFWIQVSVICFNVLIALLLIIENLRFWKQLLQLQVDPDGKSAETYGNPTFDADSPEVPRRNYITNGNAVAYTETSGHPYNANIIPNGGNCNNQNAAAAAPKSPAKEAKPEQKQEQPDTLTYENESYLENSPSTARKMN